MGNVRPATTRLLSRRNLPLFLKRVIVLNWSLHPYHLTTGVRLATLDEGAGRPILALHGFTGTARRHLGSVIEALASNYRLIAPDLRGYGASQPPPRDFPADFYMRDALDAAALVEAVGCGPVMVLGFSDGAESALILAAERPDLVQGVVAWGVSGVVSAEMLASLRDWLPVSAWGPERAAWREAIIREHGQAQLEPLISGWVAAAQAIYAAGGDICLGRAERIRCPVLLINGAGEVGNTLRDVTTLAARIPNCRLEIIPDSGHAVHVDQAQRFMALVRAFSAECWPT